MFGWSLLLNTLAFGYGAFTNEKMGVSHLLPRVMVGSFLITLALIMYFVSFALILLSPGGLIRNLLAMAAMQFLINHLIWGTITGVVGGLGSSRKLNELKKEHGLD